LGSRITHKLPSGQILYMQPDVLALDEPTNARDAEIEERLTGVLASPPQAMVIITYDERFLARLATRRVRLDGGLLVDETGRSDRLDDRDRHGASPVWRQSKMIRF
jgi:cobalt/nickel transport system ATP-binding protein